nr:hypothetical protein [Terriglobales bacterium]
MASYPSRCQHLKVNGTQCGSPALQRNRYCFFHKRWNEQRIVMGAKHRRARHLDLPVLEDANSLQVALMQVTRLIAAGDIDQKSAGLLLYAIQIASYNLRHTCFEPADPHQVVLNPRDARDMPLGEYDQWSDEDFEEEEDTEEEDEADEDEPVIAKAGQPSDAAKYKSEPPPRLPPSPAKPDLAPLTAAQLEARKHIWPYQWDSAIADKIRQGVLPPDLGISYLEYSWYRNRMHNPDRTVTSRCSPTSL